MQWEKSFYEFFSAVPFQEQKQVTNILVLLFARFSYCSWYLPVLHINRDRRRIIIPFFFLLTDNFHDTL
jgi:hypothetical protein